MDGVRRVFFVVRIEFTGTSWDGALESRRRDCDVRVEGRRLRGVCLLEMPEVTEDLSMARLKTGAT